MKRWLCALPWIVSQVACTNELPPQRDCLARVWVAPDDGAPRVIGSWNAYALPGIPVEPHESGWKLARFDLPPGDHGYLLDRGAEITLDPEQPLTTFDQDEREVSLLSIGDCNQPSLQLSSLTVADGRATANLQFLANRDADELVSVSAITTDGEVWDSTFDPARGAVTLDGAMSSPRQTFVVTAEDANGNAAAKRVAVWNEERDPRDEVIYQVMIDRFADSDGEPLAPPIHAGARAGGTLDGVRSRLPEIEQLGATALWLSPIYQGPEEERAGNDGRSYTGYHGYWPIDTRSVDTRIGGDAAMDDLVDAAHDQAMLMIADVVPNHVYETHPRFAEHPDWFHAAGCVCGTESCPWSAHIEECWFTPYLPDFRLENPEALNATVDDVSWLVERFQLDGVRVDAVPMMRRAVTRRLAHRLRNELAPEGRPLLVGEIFTGAGIGELDQLRPFLGAAGLESVFDFPLMWAMHDAIATGRGGFDAVDALLDAEEELFEGSGAVLGRILDNHDTPRFVSIANGDGQGDPWNAPAAQPTHAEPYRRLQVALALIFTLPGMPVLFQGDEIGLAGANDPDCRRVMPSDDALNPHQREVRATTTHLGQLRQRSTALRRGIRKTLLAERESYVFARTEDEQTVLVLLHTGPEERIVDLTQLSPLSAPLVDSRTGSAIDPSTVRIGPLDFVILVPQSPTQP